MRLKSMAGRLLRPGLMATYAFCYYEPTNKRIKRLLKKHPRRAQALWIDAFNAGVEKGRVMGEEDTD